jgi:hypothetical protein
MLGYEIEVSCGAVRERVVADVEEARTGPGATWSIRDAGDIEDGSGYAGSVLLGTGSWKDGDGMLGKTPRYCGWRGSPDRGAKS